MDVIYYCAALLFLQGYASATCGYPGRPAHSWVTFSDLGLAEGTIATYECERGFELLGPSRSACGPGGQWTPDGIPFCVVNVAAGKAPMQSSTEDGGVPQRALDGSSAPVFSADTCTLTKTEGVPWWYVNLLEPYMVQLVRLDFGKPCCGANNPATIVIRVGNNRPDLGSNPICNRFNGFIEEGRPLFLPCNPPMPGAFVSVHLEASTTSQLSICEAFVYTDQALPIERCPQFRDQPPGSTATYNGKCYIFYDRQPATFNEALNFCRARGGTLVDESNPALQGFISWELWRRHRSDSSSQYWLGAIRDPNDVNNWKWLTGENVTVSFWNSPGGTEVCARFDGSKGWLWEETDCRSTHNYICQHRPKTCGNPEQPPNSTMVAVGDYAIGASVEYSCDNGYLLVGPTTRTCLDTGFFDEFPPVCKKIECGPPAEIKNGGYSLLNGSVAYLGHVLYSCNPGFEMTGRARLVCDIDERWNGPPPKCEEIHCMVPGEIANGRAILVRNTTTSGSVVEYTCVRGFELHGASRAKCLPSGLWNNPPPTCQQPITSTTTTTTSTSTTTTMAALSLEPTPSSTSLPLTTPRNLRRTSPWPPPVPPPVPTPVMPQTSSPVFEKTRPRHRSTERPTTPYYGSPPLRKVTEPDTVEAPTSHVPHIIVANHPRKKELFETTNNIRAEHTSRVGTPTTDGGEHLTARLNIAILLLVAFGALVFLIAIITTIVILVRSLKNKREKQYPDMRRVQAVQMSSGDSSSSESPTAALSRHYLHNWSQLSRATDYRNKNRIEFSREHPKNPTKDRYVLGVNDGREQSHRDTNGTNAGARRHHHHHHHSVRSDMPIQKILKSERLRVSQV